MAGRIGEIARAPGLSGGGRGPAVGEPAPRRSPSSAASSFLSSTFAARRRLFSRDRVWLRWRSEASLARWATGTGARSHLGAAQFLDLGAQRCVLVEPLAWGAGPPGGLGRLLAGR